MAITRNTNSTFPLWSGIPTSIRKRTRTRWRNCYATSARRASRPENVFHTLLDMANIRYSTEQLDRSFLSRKLKRHKRYVDSYGWTNYDNAIIKGDCREVIDKGKPLAQEK